MQGRVLRHWLAELKDRIQSNRLRLLCLELGCGLGARDVRSELDQVMEQFPAARYIRINLEALRAKSLLISIDYNLSQ